MRLTLTLISLLFSMNVLAETRLYVFDCGSISMSDVSAFGLTNDETEAREMFVPCYIIEHEAGRLLWDGGLPLALAGRPPQEDQGAVMSYDRSLIEQMADMGLTPADVDLMAFSHFHFDHVGAANAFRASRLLIQQTEYDAAFKNAADNPIFNPALYNQIGDSQKTLLNGDYDVFGDGSVTLISAPGHTPGHQTLLINLENTGPLMLSGDLYHFEENRSLRRPPHFNTNAEETLRSMDKVEAIIEETGATLWIEHNMALARTLKKAPEYYD